MRDPGVIDALDALERYARAFDAISEEQDARYSARSFVRWVRLETMAPPDAEHRPKFGTRRAEQLTEAASVPATLVGARRTDRGA